jgi:hypothetical protein
VWAWSFERELGIGRVCFSPVLARLRRHEVYDMYAFIDTVYVQEAYDGGGANDNSPIRNPDS